MNKYSSAVVLPSFIIVGICAAFIGWLSYIVFYDNNFQVYAENSLIENTQAYLLVIASIIYLTTALVEKRSDKLVMVFCSVLCLGFLLRELDVENFDIPHALILMGSGLGRNIILIVAFVVILGCAALKFSHYKMAATQFLKSRSGWLLIAGGAFLLVGQFFEKNSIISHHHVFLEEINELFGYVLILLSSVTSISLMGSAIDGCPNQSMPIGE